jgi:hypothetical protein
MNKTYLVRCQRVDGSIITDLLESDSWQHAMADFMVIYRHSTTMLPKTIRIFEEITKQK